MKNEILEKARGVILEHGWNSTAYQLLNPGIKRWFFGDNAMVGYVSTKNVNVVGGAPVCPEDLLEDIAARFEEFSALEYKRVCYFGAEARLEKTFERSNVHSKILLGAQPVWEPGEWGVIFKDNSSLRAQVNRAANKGVEIKEWSPDEARDQPELRTALSEWLSSKGLPPLHFMVEPDTLSRLADRRIFVANVKDEIKGFVILSPIPTRNGWLFEQFIHRPAAPNGTVESMIDTAMRSLADDGFTYATLGLSPLSVRADVKPFDNPFLVRFFLAWTRKHGQRFYNFDGLDAFKAKLKPVRWEPVFAISNEPEFSLGTLFAILAAFSGNHPVRTLSKGLWRALRTEMKMFRQMTGRHV